MRFNPIQDRRTPFLRLPEWLLHVEGLKREAVLTYAAILSFWKPDRPCHPGIGTLATRLGLSRRAVMRHIQHLQDLGVLRVRRQRDTSGRLHGLNEQRVNHYEFASHPAFERRRMIAPCSAAGDTTGVVSRAALRVVSAKPAGSDIQGAGGGVARVTLGDTDLEDRQEETSKRGDGVGPTTAGHLNLRVPISPEEVDREWHLFANRNSPGKYLHAHAAPAWRKSYEITAIAIEAVRGDPRAALTGVMRWFWEAPSGPIVSGRVKHPNPRQLATYISRDLAEALDWLYARRGAAETSEAAQ